MAKFKSGDLKLKTDQKITLGDSDESTLTFDSDTDTLEIDGDTTFRDKLIQGPNSNHFCTTYLLYNTTTDNTQTELFIDGVSSSIIMPDDTTWAFHVIITARRTDVNGESAAYEMKGVIDRNSGTINVVGDLIKDVIYEDTDAWDVSIEVSTDDNSLVILVTGENSKTISWTANIEIVDVTG